jgi:23S rRNA (guanosine2251-2'-O)-methyltransferase
MEGIIEGRHPVIEALKAGRHINKIWLTSDIGRHAAVVEILRLSQARGIPVEYVAKHIIDETCTTSVHQGVIAHAATKEYVDLEDLFTVSREKDELPLYCIIEGVEDPRNLGAILRTAEASGIHGVIIRSRRAVGLTATVAKASAGAVEYMPVARVPNISQAIMTLKKRNVWVIGIDYAGEVEYSQVDFKLPTAIVVGGEGKGLSVLVKKRCDLLAYIPMRGKITSLNVSIATALVMYEALKQRSPDFHPGIRIKRGGI